MDEVLQINKLWIIQSSIHAKHLRGSPINTLSPLLSTHIRWFKILTYIQIGLVYGVVASVHPPNSACNSFVRCNNPSYLPFWRSTVMRIKLFGWKQAARPWRFSWLAQVFPTIVVFLYHRHWLQHPQTMTSDISPRRKRKSLNWKKKYIMYKL